jgi:hypothetical protein
MNNKLTIFNKKPAQSFEERAFLSRNAIGLNVQEKAVSTISS